MANWTTPTRSSSRPTMNRARVDLAASRRVTLPPPGREVGRVHARAPVEQRPRSRPPARRPGPARPAPGAGPSPRPGRRSPGPGPGRGSPRGAGPARLDRPEPRERGPGQPGPPPTPEPGDRRQGQQPEPGRFRQPGHRRASRVVGRSSDRGRPSPPGRSLARWRPGPPSLIIRGPGRRRPRRNLPDRVGLPMDLNHPSSLDFPDPSAGEWVDPAEERARLRRTLRRCAAGLLARWGWPW